MKKALLLILGIIAVCFLIANADYLSDFLNTMMTGALVPIIIAIILMLGRHLVQAESYNAAFDAVGHKTGFWHNVVLIFSLVFINTFCLFSGATGVAFIIDDAHRQGCDAGQSTGGAILSQIGYFAAVFVISVIGFFTMWISGHMNTVFLVGGLLLAGVLVILSSLFFIGHLRPRVLYRVFMLIQKLVNKVLGIVKRSLKPGWGRTMAHSFVNTSNLLAQNPSGSVTTIAYASFSAILNMACLVAIGYAFGFENVEALVAAFAVAAISVILSPTPQGVGVVEAMIVAILTAYGCSVATAAAIALVYRGIMFWIPFCIGAVLLSQSGFFKSKKSATQLQKNKDIGWVAGTLVFIIGIVNIGLVFVPDAFVPYTMLTSWIDMSSLVVGVPLILASLLLMVSAVGLVLRFRTAWALTISGLILIGGCEFVFRGTWQVGVASILLFCWMFWKRDAFDRPFTMEALKADLAEWRERLAKKRVKRAEDAGDEKKLEQARAEEVRGEAEIDELHEQPADETGISEWEQMAEAGRAIGQKVIDEATARLPEDDEE